MMKAGKECYGKMSMNCVPEDVWKFILKKQFDYKAARSTQTVISLQETVFRIIRSHQDFETNKPK